MPVSLVSADDVDSSATDIEPAKPSFRKLRSLDVFAGCGGMHVLYSWSVWQKKTWIASFSVLEVWFVPIICVVSEVSWEVH